MEPFLLEFDIRIAALPEMPSVSKVFLKHARPLELEILLSSGGVVELEVPTTDWEKTESKGAVEHTPVRVLDTKVGPATKVSLESSPPVPLLTCPEPDR